MTTERWDQATKLHKQIGWGILILLLLLRIPYTLAIIYFLPIENQMGAAVFEVGAYVCILLLIWWERNRLRDFHVDGAALFLIIFFRPLQTLILNYWNVDAPLAFPRLAAWMIWLAAICLSLALWQSGYRPSRPTLRTVGWLVIGILAGVGVSILENFKVFQSMVNDSNSALSTSVVFSTSLNLVYHLGFAPLIEEPLFRGFLWGYLRQLKWREGWIWLFQAALFASAHAYFAKQFPLTFWVLIPAAGLLFGLLTWRSRSIAPAILAHALINGSVYVLAMMLLSQL
jgi:membrane protease YdiL (CAAX protease family)